MTKCKVCEETKLKDERGRAFTTTSIGALIITVISSIFFNATVGMMCGLMTFLALLIIAEIRFKV